PLRTSILSLAVVLGQGPGNAQPQVASITITSQPEPQLVQESDTAIFSVSAASTEPLFYQWRRNGTDISGANRSTLSFANLTVKDLALYAVEIRNATTAVVSDAVGLNVYQAGTVPIRVLSQGAGDVIFTPAGIDCGPGCNSYATGASVSLGISASS